MKRVLLTGATGYIGQFAIRPLLAKGFTVHAVTSKSFKFKNTDNLFWHQANLLNTEETKILTETVCPTHLLHFAWYVEHGKFWSAVENLNWLQASLNLAKQFIKNGGQRIVAAGTCAEYDWTSKNPFSENKTPFCPRTFYGATKYALSLTLEKFAETGNLSFASGKIFFPFGANEPPNRLIPSVIRALLKNKPAETSHGNQIRDFLYVEEIARAFVALLDSDVQGAVNIASGEGVKLKEIVETVAEVIGKPELLRIGSLPAQANEPLEIVADIGRLREEVKFNSALDLKTQLKATIDWWMENL